MASSTDNTIDSGLPALHHVGFFVADLDKSIERLRSTLGYGPIWSIARADLPAATLHNGITGFSLGMGFASMGNLLLELIQPLDDRSPHHAFLTNHGEGLHHLGYWVQGISDHLSRLESRGMTRTADNTSHDHGIVSWAYLEGQASGAIIELMDRDASSEEFFRQVNEVISRG